MAEYSQSTYRAFMVPDHRVTASTLQTAGTETEAGPQPGFPTAQQDTDGVLSSSGTQAADGALRVKCIRAGHVQRNVGAGFAWQQSADSTWRGQDQPHFVSAIEFEDWANSTTKGFGHIITLADDQVLSVYIRDDGAGNDVVFSRRRATAGTWGAEVQVYSEATVASQENGPCLVELPGGNVLCFYWTLANLTPGMQVSAKISADKGDTWTKYADYVLPASFGDTSTDATRPLRAAYSGGQIILMAWWTDESAGSAGEDLLYQYASDSNGSSFALVDSTAGGSTATSYGFADVVALPSGGFLLGFARQDDLQAAVVRLGSAFQKYTDETKVDLQSDAGALLNGRYIEGGLSLAVMDTGTVYCSYYDPGNENNPIEVSYDEGVTWVLVGHNSNRHWFSGDSGGGVELYTQSMTQQRGRLIVTANVVVSAATGDDAENSQAYIFLGGFSDITLPYDPLQAGGFGHDVASFGTTWLPFDLPTGWAGWTVSGAFSTEALASPGVLDLHNAAGQDYYEMTPTTTPTQGIIVLAQFSRQSGNPGFDIYIENGSSDTAVRVTISDTVLTFAGLGGGGTIATGTVVDNTQYQFLCAISGQSATCWFRAADTGEDREWTLVGSTEALTQAAIHTADEVRWGAVASGAQASEWAMFQVAEGAATGALNVSLAGNNLTNPDDLIPVVIGSTPTYIDAGVKLKGQDGPFVFEDDFNIDTRYDFPIENVMPLSSPSPNEVWRSTTTADQDIEWELDSDAGADLPSDLIGIWVDNSNISGILLAAETTPGGGFSTIYDASRAITVLYTRVGGAVELTAVNASQAFYIEADEFKGCNFAFDATDSRVITRNTGGLVGTAAATANLRPTLYCDTIDDTEPASGTGYLIPKRSLMVISIAGVKWSDIRVRVKQVTGIAVPAEGYWYAGLIAFGAVHVLGQDNSQTRRITRVANVNMQTAPDGRRKTRKRGPARQTFQLDWTEGVETSPIYDATADYILASDVASAEAVAMRFDAPMALRGLQRWTDGADEPLLYIPRLPHITTANNVIVKERAKGSRWVRMTSPLQLDTMLGTEEGTEVIRASATFEEEV